MSKTNIKQIIQKNLIDFLVVIALMGAMTLLFYISDIKCVFKYLIGIPCPGCGLTRAWLQFFKLDLMAALKWHPLFWIVPVIIVTSVFLKGKVFKSKAKNAVLWIIIAALIIGVYIIRMIALFPNKAPMDYNKQSLVYKWFVSR